MRRGAIVVAVAVLAVGAVWPLHVRAFGIRVKCGAAAVAALHPEPPASCQSHAHRWLLATVALSAIAVVSIEVATTWRSSRRPASAPTHPRPEG